MPHLTAAHARMQGGKNSARVPRPPSIWTGRPHVLQEEPRPTLEQLGGCSSSIDISDRVSEVSPLTLLNAQ